MRRFYFHLIRGTERVPEEEGEYLRDDRSQAGSGTFC
ncbi:hypothetical protein ACVWVY_007941 [Bradyrhizobium sp. URHC0002]